MSERVSGGLALGASVAAHGLVALWLGTASPAQTATVEGEAIVPVTIAVVLAASEGEEVQSPQPPTREPPSAEVVEVAAPSEAAPDVGAPIRVAQAAPPPSKPRPPAEASLSGPREGRAVERGAPPSTRGHDNAQGGGAQSPTRQPARYALGSAFCPKPPYPRMARMRGQEGRVTLRVQVAADGRVAEVQVDQGSGHSLLDRAAVRTVAGWRLEPARQGGRPVATVEIITIRFDLRDA